MNVRTLYLQPIEHLKNYLSTKSLPANSVFLRYRQIYILPTKQGFVFAFLLLVMLIGAINYANNLGFILTFLLASISIVSIIHTFKNLLNLNISAGKIRPAFCGENLKIPIVIQNDTKYYRYSVRLKFDDQNAACDINAHNKTTCLVSHATHQRGLHRIKRLTVSSTYPLGLFRAWSYVNLNASYIVYPKIAGDQPIPVETPGVRQSSGNAVKGNDDFMGLRNYVVGDTLRQVHWKAVARGQGMYTKEFGGESIGELWLDWQDVNDSNPEAKLSQLALWLLEADSMRIKYGLRLPGKEIPLNTGAVHLQECLTTLAMYGLPT